MGGTQKLVMAFVTLIIGISLIGVVATEVNTATSVTTISNESFNLIDFKNLANQSMINTTQLINLTNAYGSDDWQWNACSVTITSMALPNGTAAVDLTDYNVTVNGLVALYDIDMWWTETGANTTNVIYTYCQDEYLDEAWNRTVIKIVPGFFAVALLMASLALFYSVAKDAGII